MSAQARLFRHLANEHNFWNCFTFLKKHQISSRSLKESFSGNSVKISDCRVFSPFETLPGCRAFRHSEFKICYHDDRQRCKISCKNRKLKNIYFTVLTRL